MPGPGCFLLSQTACSGPRAVLLAKAGERYTLPQVVFDANPAHKPADALEALAKLEERDLDRAVENAPARLPGKNHPQNVLDHRM